MENLLSYFIYILIEFLACLFAKNSKKKVLIILSAVVPILFIGLRYNVGTDYNSYLSMYNSISKIDNISTLLQIDWEIGALFLFKIVSLLFTESKIIFIFLAILTILPIIKINKQYDYEYLPLSMLIFNLVYMPFCMNGMRQGIAMSLILYSFTLILSNQNKKSIVFFVLSCLFHKSAIFLIPYYILLLLDKNNEKSLASKNIIRVTIIMSILILFFLKDIFIYLNISFYDFYINNININNLSLSYFIMYIPTIIILLFMKSKDKFINVYKSMIISGYILSLIGTSAQYLNRLGYYFTFFEILLIPYLLNKINNKNTKFFITFIYVIYLIIFFVIQFYIFRRHEIFPYNTWIM